MTNRRVFLSGLTAAFLQSNRALAQSAGKLPLIGVLVSASPPHPFADAFRRGLRVFGYVEGQNILIEWRYTNGRSELAGKYAADLVQHGVGIIVAHFTPAVRAAMKATQTIPIVMAPAGAPLQTGFIASLARPGGNVTGLSGMDAELGGKRLQLLHEIIPNLTCVAVLASTVATDPYGQVFVQDFQSAAMQAGLRLEPLMVDGPDDFENAFAKMHEANAQAVVIQPLFDQYRTTILEFATKYRLPVMSSNRAVTAAGGLLNFSANYSALYERPAYYVDQILKGVKPGDLPVGQPTSFEMAINKTTAQGLGLTIPPLLLVQADELIE
jgi:putative ABC transport system substrate-binding protein